MITNEFAEAAAEINEILGYLPQEQVEKIPAKLRDFFTKVKKEGYVSKIDPHKLLDEQVLLPKTEILLTVLYRNYWCSQEERAELDKILIENDKKYEEELREKYNPDNIFRKNDNYIEENELKEDKLVIVEEKKSIIKTFISLLKKIFRK